MKTIYCVEDDENIRELTVYALNAGGFEAHGFESADKFFSALKTTLPSLVLLDIMLPGKDGYAILKQLRQERETSDIPVIMLTAKSLEYDKVKGLDSGADDYITKPFSVVELLSRIKAVLRRYEKSDTEKDAILTYREIVIDTKKREVTVKGEAVYLTYKEFELLSYLVKNHGIVLSRDKIMSVVWGFDFEGETRTVDVHIRSLRHKLGECGRYIETARNIGYKIGG